MVLGKEQRKREEYTIQPHDLQGNLNKIFPSLKEQINELNRKGRLSSRNSKDF